MEITFGISPGFSVPATTIRKMKNIEINTTTIELFNIFVMQQDVDRLPVWLFEGKMGYAF